MKIPRECHNHEAQSSRGSKRIRNQKQTLTQETSHLVPQTHEQRRVAIEEPPLNGQQKKKTTRELKSVLFARNLALNSDATRNYKPIFGPHRAPLPHQ